MSRQIAKIITGLVCAGALASSANATIAPNDYIGSIFFSGASNFAVRITPRTSGNLSSSCTGNFAYLNVSADNYQAYVAGLISAYMSGKQVSLTYNLVNSYCQIIEFNVIG